MVGNVRRVLLSALVLLPPLAACGKAAPTSAPPPPSQPSVSESPCPTPRPASANWPVGVPADFPKPAGLKIASTNTAGNGVTVVRFDTPVSLRQAVLFIIKKLPPQGFTLGRGDAEAAEADAPFARGSQRGVLRVVTTGDCKTTWLLAVVDTAAGNPLPLLPSHSPSGSTSPLPFG